MMLQGIVGGLTVVLGVVLAEWLQRMRQRDDQVRGATLELAMLMPHVVWPLLDTEYGRSADTSVGSRWSDQREHAVRLLNVIRVTARHGQRRRKRIISHANDLSARLVAAELDLFGQGLRLPRQSVLDLTTADLYAAVFGKREPIDDEIAKYRRS